MEKNIIYGFLVGLHAGRFTNMVSNLIITAAAIYFIEPNFYSYSNLNNIKEVTFKFLSK